MREILRKADYPTNILVIDFETYFDKDYSLKKLSTVEYITDPRFELLGLALYYASGSEPYTAYQTPQTVENLVKSLDWASYTVVAHNAQFDLAILSFRYGIHPPYVIDTLGLSRHRRPGGKHTLEALSEEFQLAKRKGDTEQFKGQHWEDIDEEKRWRLEEYAMTDVFLTHQLFEELLPQLSRPEFELPLMQHPLELYTQPRLTVDEVEAHDQIIDLEERLEAKLEGLSATREEISGNIAFQERLETELTRCGEVLPLKQGKKGPILALAKNDPEREDLLNHPDPIVKGLIEARCLVRSLPLHIKRIRNLVGQNKPLGRLPVSLQYCGARTGRWAGGEGINMQNLPKHTQEAKELRSLIVPPPKHKLVVCDASQIECRLLAWLAGQEDLLEQFETGQDPYTALAEAMGSGNRQMGKVGILGCGYGMGAKKCQAYAKHQFGFELTKAQAKRIVRTYRTQYSRIPFLWGRIKAACEYCLTSNLVARVGPLQFEATREGAMFIRLPSGRKLVYWGCEFYGEDLWVDRLDGSGNKQSIWGGFLTENIVQAMSRDHIAECVLDLQDVAFHAHDEIICVADEVRSQVQLDAMRNRMTTPVPWAPGCPLAAEGRIADNYGVELSKRVSAGA